MARFLIFLLFFPLPAFAQIWQSGESGIVTAVIDGDEFVLDSGLNVRLAQIEAPRITNNDIAGENSRQILSNLILNKKVQLKYGGLRRDRMGRALAQVFIDNGVLETPLWVNIELLKQGAARVHTYKDNHAEMAQFWLSEREARRQNLGLWQNPKFQARFATLPALIGAEGSFQLVEGKVSAEFSTPHTIHILFGNNRETDFAAVIPESAYGEFGGAAAIQKLVGMNIRVRGRIQGAVAARTSKNGKIYAAHGPQIWLDHKEQIEFLLPK